MVEGFAVAKAGQGVGDGVAAHLGQVITQLGHLGGGFLQFHLQRTGLVLGLAGGVGQAGDQLAQGSGRGVLQFRACAGQGLAIGFIGQVGRLDRLGHDVQFAAQLVARVLQGPAQVRLGQELRGQGVADGFGEGVAGRGQPVDLRGERRLGIGHIEQPQLVIPGSRPDLVLDHGVQRLTRHAIGIRPSHCSFEFGGMSHPRLPEPGS